MKTWEKNYKLLKRYNNYPYEFIVSHTLRNFKPSSRLKVLDLGCGGGGNTKFLVEEGFSAYAVDGSKTAVDLTKKKLTKDQQKKIYKADFNNLPFKKDFFNFIIDRASLTHNTEKNLKKKIVPEVSRVLKKNGIIISLFWSTNHSDKIYGSKINGEKNSYHNFKKGNFFYSPKVFFSSKKNLKEIFKNYKFLDMTKVNEKPIFDKKKIIEYFIIVVKKK